MRNVKTEEKEWLQRKGYSKKVLLSSEEIKPEGHVVQMVKSRGHTQIAPHFHKETTEIYHILQGSATLLIGEREFQAEPRETYLCEPGEIHGVINDTNEDFLILVFKINTKENDLYWAEK
ncbi:MAG: cupin domain-containing protein [Thermoproteota archaeon]